jgi:hypothetical protein
MRRAPIPKNRAFNSVSGANQGKAYLLSLPTSVFSLLVYVRAILFCKYKYIKYIMIEKVKKKALICKRIPLELF